MVGGYKSVYGLIKLNRMMCTLYLVQAICLRAVPSFHIGETFLILTKARVHPLWLADEQTGSEESE